MLDFSPQMRAFFFTFTPDLQQRIDRDTHPKLMPAVLASLQLNQMMIGEAFEELAVWLEKEGTTEVAEKIRGRVSDLRISADVMDRAIAELLRSEETMH